MWKIDTSTGGTGSICTDRVESKLAISSHGDVRHVGGTQPPRLLVQKTSWFPACSSSIYLCSSCREITARRDMKNRGFVGNSLSS